MPRSGCWCAAHGGPRSVVGAVGRHPDVDDGEVGAVLSNGVHQGGGIGRLGPRCRDRRRRAGWRVLRGRGWSLRRSRCARQDRFDDGAEAGLLSTQLPAVGADTVGSPASPEPARGAPPVAVVGDADVQLAGEDVDVEGDRPGAGVLDGVGDRLGGDVVGGGLDVLVEVGGRDVQLIGSGGGARPAGTGRGRGRRRDSWVGCRGRAAGARSPRCRARRRPRRARRSRRRRVPGGVGPAAAPSQRHQPLLGSVVQVAFEADPLLVADPQQARPALLGLREGARSSRRRRTSSTRGAARGGDGADQLGRDGAPADSSPMRCGPEGDVACRSS